MLLPSLRQLTYLAALHDHGHFGRAAAACFVTQSTLSVGIAELERLLGTLLVERSRRSVRFTSAGEEVARRARIIIREGEDLVAVARGAREPLAGAMRLAVIPTVAPFLLPAILAALDDRWPRLKPFVREMLTGPACEALARGTADCVLLALPAACGDVEAFEIVVDRLVLATPAAETEAGSAASQAPIPFARIDGDRLLLLEDGHCLRDHALAACKVADAPADARLVASTLDTLVRLVDAGRGVTLLPRMAVAAGILDGARVHVRPVAGDAAERRISLVWRNGHPRGDEFRLLGRTIRDAVAPPPTADPPAVTPGVSLGAGLRAAGG